jgi:hypothetical protein
VFLSLWTCCQIEEEPESALFGRRKKASSYEVAEQLFKLFVVQDFETDSEKWREHYGHTVSFKTDTFREKLFVYLAASLAIALVTESQANSFALNVLYDLKPLIVSDLRRRWKTPAEPDDLVQAASMDLARLLFIDPQSGPSLSLEWPKEWLLEVSIEEANPLTLFKFSHFWKNHHICVTKSVALLVQENI